MKRNNHITPIRCIAIVVLLLLATIHVSAQNRIDKFMDNISTKGHCELTSVVKRDPQTRKVLKVVKVLTLNGLACNDLVDVVRSESSSGTFSEKSADGQTVLTLTFADTRTTRIYVLDATPKYSVRNSNKSADAGYSKAVLTAIVKYK